VNPPPGPPRAPNPFQPPPAGSYAGGGGPPAGYRPPPPASSEAIAALVCGILAWICFPVGFVAVFLGIRARRAVRENPEQVGGDQLALVGMILGGIFGTLQFVIVLLYVLFFAFAFSGGLGHIKP